jgi:hypothetical protein
MKTILTLLALTALTFTAHAQTNRGLFYNTTNFTVLGWTNTNALTFTNKIKTPEVFLTLAGEDDAKIANEGGALALYGNDGLVASMTASQISFRGPLIFEGGAATTNMATTRSNLFGSVGISTNIQFVRVGGTTNTLVFSNGLLHSVTTP